MKFIKSRRDDIFVNLELCESIQIVLNTNKPGMIYEIRAYALNSSDNSYYKLFTGSKQDCEKVLGEILKEAV